QPAAQPAKPTTPGAKPASATTPAAAAPPVDGGWPRSYVLPSGGSILMYQPQISSWDNQAHLVALSAVSYKPKGADKTAVGTVKLEADTKVSTSERLVSLRSMKISEAHFESLPKDQVRDIAEEIDKAVPDDERVIALDRIIVNLDKSSIAKPKNVEGIKSDPPPI